MGNWVKRWKFLGQNKFNSLIHIGSWDNSLFPLLDLWGNKNWLPSMKVEKLEIFQNKVGLKGCNWSNLNAPGTETPVSHPFVGRILFSCVLNNVL